MKAFNLEKALAGAPVRLRNGYKGFVVRRLYPVHKANDALMGYMEFGVVAGGAWQEPMSWSLTGRYLSLKESDFDIVEMWA